MMADVFDQVLVKIVKYLGKLYNISLVWIKASHGDDFPQTNHDSSEGEQWGRYNTQKYDQYFMKKNGSTGWTQPENLKKCQFGNAGIWSDLFRY